MSQRSDLRSAAGEQLSKLEAELPTCLQNHIINANRDSVIAACRDGFLRLEASPGMATLRRNLVKRSGRPSVRALVASGSQAINAVKPVIITSPTGVARRLSSRGGRHV